MVPPSSEIRPSRGQFQHGGKTCQLSTDINVGINATAKIGELSKTKMSDEGMRNAPPSWVWANRSGYSQRTQKAAFRDRDSTTVH